MTHWITFLLGILLFSTSIMLVIVLIYIYNEKKRQRCILTQTISEINELKDKNNNKYLDLKIPRRIVQCCPDKNNIAPEFQANIDYIKKLNPNWEHTLYDNNEQKQYITKHYPEYLQYYLAINPKYGAALSDFFRYLIMYREGGVYLDLKSAMKYPLDNVIYPSDEYILSHWGGVVGWPHEDILKKYGEFQQWHIICAEKHPALKAVIEKVIQNIQHYDVVTDGIGKIGVLRTTGPIAYTQAILPIIYRYNFRILKSDMNIGLIYNNLEIDHQKLFGKAHYSNVREKIILDVEMLREEKSHQEENKSIELILAPHCRSILELGDGHVTSYINKRLKPPGKHVVLDSDKPSGDGYTVIRKSVKDITEEDLAKFRPISCVVIYCANCLRDLLRTSIGRNIIKDVRNIIDKSNNTAINQILNDLDFVVTDTGYGHNSDVNMSIYTKVLDHRPREYFRLPWETINLAMTGI